MIAGATYPRPRTASGSVALRRATAQDSSRILAWNGAPEVRARSRDPRPISPEDHARWFAARLADPSSSLWIALLDDCPVGVVRIDRDGPIGRARRASVAGRARTSAAGRARAASRADLVPGRISIVLDASVRGRGLGRKVIALACAADGGPVVAEILADNHASKAAFLAAGFVPDPRPPVEPPTSELRPVVRYLWSPRHVHVY